MGDPQHQCPTRHRHRLDTGEAELDHADVESGQGHPEHHLLQTEEDLFNALSGLVQWMRSPAH
jgi:hypothetical protein